MKKKRIIAFLLTLVLASNGVIPLPSFDDTSRDILAEEAAT